MLFRRFALAFLVFFYAGCGSSQDFSARTGEPGATGNSSQVNLYMQGPPATGQVTVLSQNGEILAQAEASAGVASLNLPPSALTNSTVRAQSSLPITINFTLDDGAQIGAGSGPATFRAVVPNPVSGHVVGVDAVSSMIANRLRANPDLTFAEAAAQVFDYLGLPMDTSPEHLFTDTEFESSVFYSHAQTVGGVDALLAQIEEELEGRVNSTPRRFLQTNITSGISLNGIATKLANSALEYIEGELKTAVTGWLQGVIGIPSDPTINDVLNAIDGLRQDIQRLSDQIATQARIQAYTAKDNVLVTQRSDASTDTFTLLQWASPTNLTPPTEAQIAAKMTEIRQRYNSTLTTAAVLELPSTGPSGQEPGLAGLYLEGTVPRLYSATTKDRGTYHLRRSLDFQQMVLNLMVEALHYETPSLLLDAESAIDTYFANYKSQVQQYPLPFDEENVLLDRQTKLFWTRRPLVAVDATAIDGLIRGYTLDGAPAGAWRLPTADELATLVSATGGTGIDQHTELGMLRDGFLPINGASMVGDWRIGDLSWLVLTNDWGRGSGTMVHVSNFRRSREWLIDYDRHADVETRRRVAFYLVRNAPVIESISISEKSRTAYSVSYTATARMSDGSNRNVTELVRWGANTSTGSPVTEDVARISNVTGSDGVLTYRTSGAPALTVTAHYNDVVGTVTVPSLTFTQPAVTGILLSPLRYHVSSGSYTSNQFQMAFHARIVRANGAVADADTEVTWTSSDPSATVSASGLVTATRPTSKKVVNITATLNGVRQSSSLVLDP